MAQDWDRQSYTDIVVTEKYSCPKNHTELYENVWYGLKAGCDCLGVCGPEMNGCYQMNLDQRCDYN